MTRDTGTSRRALFVAFGCALTAAAPSSHASFLSGEALDTAADYLALFILFAVPIGAIVLFWLVHILPEKAAEKRHHPQKQAINTLCLLSLAFGGLLWPLAWLWAYTRPVAYKTAYGTDKHEDFFREMAEKAEAGTLPAEELARVVRELDQIEADGKLTLEMRVLYERLRAVQASGMAPALSGVRDESAEAARPLPQQSEPAVNSALSAPAGVQRSA
jgi:hypothetical protein